MEKHDDIRLLISGYFDGEISAEEKQAVEAHLSKCPECQKYFNDLQKMSSSLKELTDETLSLDSEQKIKTVLKNPARKEEGIAPKTTAVMKRNDTQKRKEEIWVMFRHANSAPPSRNAGLGNAKAPMRIKIISAWRYPGTSPKDKAIPIPEDILEELTGIL